MGRVGTAVAGAEVAVRVGTIGVFVFVGVLLGGTVAVKVGTITVGVFVAGTFVLVNVGGISVGAKVAEGTGTVTF